MRKPVIANKASKGSGPYSQGVIAGGFVFVSGQGPEDPDTGGIVGNTIEAQANLTLQNIQHIVEAAGSSMEQVVKVNVFLADMNDFERFNVVYKTYFQAPMPARTCVAAGLGDILVEIDAIAQIVSKV